MSIDSVFLLSISLLLSFFVTPLALTLAKRFGVIDHPSQAHKIHKEPIPYLGGLAILIPVWASLLLFLEFTSEVHTLSFIAIQILLPPTVLSVIGFVDDARNLGPLFKLLIQLATAILVSLLLISDGIESGLTEFFVINSIITISWLVTCTNAFNFIDNIDGGLLGVTIVTAFSCLIFSANADDKLLKALCYSIIGACIGLLFWNRHPARIYLGDGGSLFLGMLMGIIGLRIDFEKSSPITSVLTVILIFAIPLLDTAVVVSDRLRGRKRPWVGGTDHISHRFLALGLKKNSVVAILCIMAVVYSSLAIWIQFSELDLSSRLSTGAAILLALNYAFLLRMPKL
jgi:UDP-GlcNAc:undecaprenyl-phosphate GlcNAc-1-phosphate transferase